MVLALTSCTENNSETYREPKELSEALLSVTDMPTGWEESQRQVFETRSNENPSIDPSVWCAQGAETAKPLETLAGKTGADVEMSKPRGSGAGASMMRLQAWSNADVQEYFTTVRQVVTSCDGVTVTDSSGVVTTTRKITGHSVGDESVSFSQKTEPPASMGGGKFTSIGRTTIARFGTTLMVIQIGDASPSDSATLMDETMWWNVVNLAANKLKK